MQMNIFLPQELDSVAELVTLATTRHKIMTSQSTKNIICVSQDPLLGMYLLTCVDKDFGREKFFDICMKGEFIDEKGIVKSWTTQYILDGLDHIDRVMKSHGKNFPLYSGKSLVSLMLPKTLDYTRKNDARSDEPIVRIVKGVLLEGAINKANIGSGHNTLIHVIYKEYGKDVAINFIDNAQFIPIQYLLHRSFSIGIQDCITSISDKTESLAYSCFIEAKEVSGEITHPKIKELKTCAILDKSRDKAQKMAKDQMCGTDNGFVSTVTSGSKGEFFNITQITSMYLLKYSPFYNRYAWTTDAHG